MDLTDIDIEGLIREIGNCCLECDVCQGEDCLIGYCKRSLITVLKQDDEFIIDGVDNLPLNDIKIYCPETSINAIGFLLNQCRSCYLYHDEECIVNIVRSALEIIILGDLQEYRGSNVRYLQEINSVDPEKAEKILKAFQNRKNK